MSAPLRWKYSGVDVPAGDGHEVTLSSIILPPPIVLQWVDFTQRIAVQVLIISIKAISTM